MMLHTARQQHTYDRGFRNYADHFRKHSTVFILFHDFVTESRTIIGINAFDPVSYTLSQTETGNLPPKAGTVLLQQKLGLENTLSIPVEKGIFVGYVKRIIPSTTTPVKTELDEAVKDWYTDLVLAVQQSYGQKYPVKINTNIIQKAFSIYENQEE